MTIDADSGEISWTPTEAQGPSTNTVSVSVTDNGSSNLSVTNSFTVIVNEVNSDRKSTRLNSSHLGISYAVFCLKKKKTNNAKRDTDRDRSARHRLTTETTRTDHSENADRDHTDNPCSRADAWISSHRNTLRSPH